MKFGFKTVEPKMSSLRDFWDRESDKWEKQGDSFDSKSFLTNKRVDYIASLIKRNREECNVLDVACGPGFISLKLAEAGFDVYGFDISKKFINHTIKRIGNKINDPELHFRVSENGEIPFAGMQFDLILAIGILPFLKDNSVYIEGLKPYLNEDGYIIASCVNGSSAYIFRSILKLWHSASLSTIMRLLRTGIWYEEYGAYYKFKQAHNIRQLDKLFLAKGFEKVDEMILFGLDLFEGNPLKRTGFNKVLSKYLGWLHYGVYRIRNKKR
jgi:2-polyprenyl-3-methyl-5-hydroxy-6-metoxy-1,4-benzoquinol methylase